MSMDLIDIAMAAAMKKGGGSGGTSDYTDLSNKPQINSVTLTGNKTAADLGLQTAIDTTHKLDAGLVDDSTSGHKFAWSGTQAQYTTDAASIPAGTPVIITDDTDIDTVPTQGSDNPVTSNGVFSSLSRLDTTTGDIYFGQTRVARLMDYDSYAALSTKENIYYLTYPTPSQNSGRSLQASPVVENENSDREDIRTEPEEPEPDESEMR